jgi:hypothetical protein
LSRAHSGTHCRRDNLVTAQLRRRFGGYHSPKTVHRPASRNIVLDTAGRVNALAARTPAHHLKIWRRGAVSRLIRKILRPRCMRHPGNGNVAKGIDRQTVRPHVDRDAIPGRRPPMWGRRSPLLSMIDKQCTKVRLARVAGTVRTSQQTGRRQQVGNSARGRCNLLNCVSYFPLPSNTRM